MQDLVKDHLLLRIRLRILQVHPQDKALKEDNSKIAWNLSPVTLKSTSSDAQWEEPSRALSRRRNITNKGATALRSSVGRIATPIVILQSILQVMARQRGRARRQMFQPGQEMPQDRCWKDSTAIRRRRIGRYKQRSSCLQGSSSDLLNGPRVLGHDLIGIAHRLPLIGKQDRSARTSRYSRSNRLFTSRRKSTTDMIRRENEKRHMGSRTTFENSRTFRT